MSEPPKTPSPGVDLNPEIAAEGHEPVPAEKPEEKKKRKEKKQIIDDVTELQNGNRRGGLGPGAKDVSSILTEHHYLPRSSLVMRLLEIREDPVAHFLPTRVTPTGTYLLAGPPGMAPELQEMFMRPMPTHQTAKRRAASPEKPPSKKPRIEESVAEDDQVEQARRAASVTPSVVLGSDVLGRGSVGPGLEGGLEFDTTGQGVEEFQMDLGDIAGGDADIALDVQRARSRSLAPSELTRLSTPGLDEPEETYADLECPIAVFDTKGSSQSSESTEGVDSKGYSKNTMKALGIVRKELQPDDEHEEEEKVMSFKKMSTKVIISVLSI